MYSKNSDDGWKLVRVCFPGCTMDRKVTRDGIYFRCIPALGKRGKGEEGEATIFPFSRGNQRSGRSRHSTFGFHILSAMPARSPGAIVGDFANPIERPFFHSLRPSTLRRDVSIPFACLLSASFLRRRFSTAFLFNRYYAIPAPDRENWEIQCDPTIREIFLLVAFVLPPLQTALPLRRLAHQSYSLYSFLRGRDGKGQRNDVNVNAVIMPRKRKGKWGKSSSAEGTSIIGNILGARYRV